MGYVPEGPSMQADVGSAATADDDVYTIVFDEAKRALEEQLAVFNDLRGRAGTVLGAASISASFLGGIALDDELVGPWGTVAILFFVLVGVGTVVILLPYMWRSTVSPVILLDQWVGGDIPATAPTMREGLARYFWKNHEGNQQILDRLWWVFRATVALLTLMVFLWLAELAGFMGVTQ